MATAEGRCPDTRKCYRSLTRAKEVTGRLNGDALEGAKAKKVLITGNDVIGSPLDRRLKHTVIALIADDSEDAAGGHHNAACFDKVGELSSPPR